MKRAVMLALLVAGVARADEPPMGLDDYLALVGRANLSLAAQRQSVDIAAAQIAVAKLFPEPTLSGGLAADDLQGSGSPVQIELGVTETVELGGKRGDRVRAASSALAGARHDLDDYLRTLKGAAADAFVDALAARLVLTRKQQTLDDLTRLVSANEERQRAGDIGAVAVTQSRVEAERFRGDVLGAQGDIRDADLALALLAGRSEPIAPIGDLRAQPRTFDEATLIAGAEDSRPDVQAARAAVDAADGKVALAHANEKVDVTFALAWQHTFPGATGSEFVAPAFDSIGLILSVPLPFARMRYHGELDGAIAARAQANDELQAALLKAAIDVKQALARYDATTLRVKLYTGGILTDADNVLAATTYNYQHGGATILEVLEAQRTVDDVYLAYFQAITDQAHALIAVEIAAGIWDVKF